MLMQVGSVTFSVFPLNTDGYEHTAQTDFARKAVVGSRQPLEHVGEGEEKMTINGMMVPKKTGGLSEMSELQALRVSAVPCLVMRGDGHLYGWFVIENISNQSSHIASDGVGHQINFSLELCRADKPSAVGSFFSLFEALLP